MNQLPAFQLTIIEEPNKKKHLFKKTNETDFSKRTKKNTECGRQPKGELTVTRRSEKYLFGETGFLKLTQRYGSANGTKVGNVYLRLDCTPATGKNGKCWEDGT